MNPENRVIINAAITGMLPVKEDSPYVPITIKEILNCVRQVRDAGASIVHLHARNIDQTPAYESAIYKELVVRVREICPDIIICLSLSGRITPEIDRRSQALSAKPDMASLTLGSFNFPTQVCANPPEIIMELAKRIYGAGAIPELEIFETGFIHFAKFLIKKEVLTPPYYFNLILGSLGAAPLDLIGLGHMINLLPPEAVWSVGGIGQYQMDANIVGLAMGGHVRVGLEDNLYYDREKTDLADNVRLIDRLVRIARELGRQPATPDETRKIIGLRPRL